MPTRTMEQIRQRGRERKKALYDVLVAALDELPDDITVHDLGIILNVKPEQMRKVIYNEEFSTEEVRRKWENKLGRRGGVERLAKQIETQRRRDHEWDALIAVQQYTPKGIE